MGGDLLVKWWPSWSLQVCLCGENVKLSSLRCSHRMPFAETSSALWWQWLELLCSIDQSSRWWSLRVVCICIAFYSKYKQGIVSAEGRKVFFFFFFIFILKCGLCFVFHRAAVMSTSAITAVRRLCSWQSLRATCDWWSSWWWKEPTWTPRTRRETRPCTRPSVANNSPPPWAARREMPRTSIAE